MPVPRSQDLEHYRGDTLTLLVTVWDDDEHQQPSDLDAATIAAQIRPSTSSPLLTEFDVTVAGNQITLALPPAKAKLLPKIAVYDCQIDWQGDEANVQTVVQGQLAAAPDVTHD